MLGLFRDKTNAKRNNWVPIQPHFLAKESSKRGIILSFNPIQTRLFGGSKNQGGGAHCDP